MKRKFKCPYCNYTEVLKEKNVQICMKCGFQTISTYTIDSQQIESMKKTAPMIIKKLMFFDKKLQQYWVPTIINIQNKGMVFPEGNENNWKWVFSPYIPIPVLERINYPIEGKEDEFYEYRLGIEESEYFDKFDFISVAKKIGYIE